MNKRVSKEKIRKPSYYVRKRLFSNPTAVFGLGIIVCSFIIALLGYLIMPDATPNANDGAGEISKQPPGFKVKMLKLRKNLAVEKVGFLEYIFFGQNSEYEIKPITEFRIQDYQVVVKIFGQNNETSFSLVDVVLPLYIGESKKLRANEQGNFILDNKKDKVTYVDLDENVNVITHKELIEVFKNNCIEERTYWLGTDRAGRDVLSRLLFGVRISLGIGFISVLISLVVGVTLGAAAGFFGGRVDALILWFMTVVWSIPSIMLVIIISLVFSEVAIMGKPLGRGIFVAFIAIGLTTWVEIARVIRGQIMSVKQKQFVEAAKAMGMGNIRIIYRHIMPNIFGPLIVIMNSNFASAILTEAGLSFLGLSAQSPMPSWGVMVSESYGFVTSEGGLYLVLYPSLCIAIMVLAFNLFGNGLRDAYDPKTK